jgi:hypothetical protein
MKISTAELTAFAAFIMLSAASTSFAQEAGAAAPKPARSRDAVVIGERTTNVQLMPLKDPNLAAIIALATPGMGHLYVGNWKRGAAFFGGVLGAFAVAGIAGDNMQLTVEDYDIGRGGNNDGVVDVQEYRNWEKNKTRDFSEISTARKAVLIGGAGTAFGLYIWNIIDAHSQAEQYIRNLYSELTGMRIGLCPTPNGMRGMVSIPLN